MLCFGSVPDGVPIMHCEEEQLVEEAALSQEEPDSVASNGLVAVRFSEMGRWRAKSDYIL